MRRLHTPSWMSPSSGDRDHHDDDDDDNDDNDEDDDDDDKGDDDNVFIGGVKRWRSSRATSLS